MSYLPWTLPAALVFAGCGASADPCRPGFSRAEDGHCYPPPSDPSPPSATDVLLGMGPCVPLKPGLEIDWLTGCAGPVPGGVQACPGDSFDAVDLAWGRGADCSLNSAETVWTCDWDGLEAAFDADDADTVQPAGGATTDWIRALAAFEGSDADGLGMGISVRCWVDVLGAPSAVVFEDPTGALAPDELYWEPYGVDLLDTTRADGQAYPDGLVDVLTMYGPP